MPEVTWSWLPMEHANRMIDKQLLLSNSFPANTHTFTHRVVYLLGYSIWALSGVISISIELNLKWAACINHGPKGTSTARTHYQSQGGGLGVRHATSIWIVLRSFRKNGNKIRKFTYAGDKYPYSSRNEGPNRSEASHRTFRFVC